MKGNLALKIAISALMLTASSTPAWSEGTVYGDTRIQAYMGVMEFDDQTGELQNESGEPVDIDFANLLNIGLDGETPVNKPESGFEWGVNAGASFGWRGSNTEYAGRVGEGGGTVAFKVDNEMLLVEGHIGPYLRTHIGEKVDFYISAGPALIYAEIDADDDNSDDDATPEPLVTSRGTIILTDDGDSDIVIGYHARAGLEFDIGGGRQWGIGFKYLGGEVDFSDTVGEFDLEGYSILLTYSAWF